MDRGNSPLPGKSEGGWKSQEQAHQKTSCEVDLLTRPRPFPKEQREIVLSQIRPRSCSSIADYLDNELAAALADYSRAIQLNPASSQAYLNRGLARLLMGRASEAE